LPGSILPARIVGLYGRRVNGATRGRMCQPRSNTFHFEIPFIKLATGGVEGKPVGISKVESCNIFGFVFGEEGQ
jgi:hypothetical protein